MEESRRKGPLSCFVLVWVCFVPLEIGFVPLGNFPCEVEVAFLLRASC